MNGNGGGEDVGTNGGGDRCGTVEEKWDDGKGDVARWGRRKKLTEGHEGCCRGS